ncbi:MAG: nucleoside-diphosphate kinase, partial [Candidatus Omnitrophica bacterium]|nr:nucleoside-diphosphate kinase [Candidatus Omnitrophota bacterium]
MRSNTAKFIIRIYAIILLAAFFIQDLVWADPDIFTPRTADNALSVPSSFTDPALASSLWVRARIQALARSSDLTQKITPLFLEPPRTDRRVALLFNDPHKKMLGDTLVVPLCVLPTGRQAPDATVPIYYAHIGPDKKVDVRTTPETSGQQEKTVYASRMDYVRGMAGKRVAFAMLKPDALERGLGPAIMKRLREKFDVFEAAPVSFSKAAARRFYRMHQKKPFINELVSYVTRGECVPLYCVLKDDIYEDASVVLRRLVAEIRENVVYVDGKELVKGENGIHGSDNWRNAIKESGAAEAAGRRAGPMPKNVYDEIKAMIRGLEAARASSLTAAKKKDGSPLYSYDLNPQYADVDVGDGAVIRLAYIPERGRYKTTMRAKTEARTADVTGHDPSVCPLCRARQEEPSVELDYDGDQYFVAPQTSPFAKEHMLFVAGNTTFQTLNARRTRHIMRFMEGMGGDYEAIFNGFSINRRSLAHKHYHWQVFKRSSRIWDDLDAGRLNIFVEEDESNANVKVAYSANPVYPVKIISGRDFDSVKNALSSAVNYVLVTQEGIPNINLRVQNGVYTFLVWSAMTETPEILKKIDDRSQLGMGVAERSGYVVVDTERVFVELKHNPGALREMLISTAMPWKGTRIGSLNWINIGLAFLASVVWGIVSERRSSPFFWGVLAFVLAVSFLIHEFGHVYHNITHDKNVEIELDSDLVRGGVRVVNSSGMSGIVASLIAAFGLSLMMPGYVVPVLLVNTVFALSLGDLEQVFTETRASIRNRESFSMKKASQNIIFKAAIFALVTDLLTKLIFTLTVHKFVAAVQTPMAFSIHIFASYVMAYKAIISSALHGTFSLYLNHHYIGIIPHIVFAIIFITSIKAFYDIGKSDEGRSAGLGYTVLGLLYGLAFGGAMGNLIESTFTGRATNWLAIPVDANRVMIANLADLYVLFIGVPFSLFALGMCLYRTAKRIVKRKELTSEETELSPPESETDDSAAIPDRPVDPDAVFDSIMREELDGGGEGRKGVALIEA